MVGRGVGMLGPGRSSGGSRGGGSGSGGGGSTRLGGDDDYFMSIEMFFEVEEVEDDRP